MLLLFSLLFNGNIQVTPPPTPATEYASSMVYDDGGYDGKKRDLTDEEKKYHKRLAQDDEVVFEIIKMWFKCQR